MLIAPSDVSGCVTLLIYRRIFIRGRSTSPYPLNILWASVCSSVRVNRSDIIGIRSSVIVRVTVVVRISGIGSGDHPQK